MGLTCLLGCAEARTETLETEVSLRYLPGCAPLAAEQLVIEALGNFPASEDRFVAFDATRGVGSLPGLSVETRTFRIALTTADFRGAALVQVSEEGEPAQGSPQVPMSSQAVLMLPFEKACAVPDVDTRGLEQAARAVSQDGTLWALGGADRAGEALGQVARLSAERGARSEDTGALFVPRVGASALRVGGEVWLLGGAQSLDAGASALPNFERFDVQGKAADVGRLRAPRVHGRAALLADGSVLWAGGQSRVGGPWLTTLERIAAGRAQAEELAATLPWQGPVRALLSRDDGVAVLIGEDAAGAQGDEATQKLALFDTQTAEIVLLEPPSFTWDPGLAVALPGARIAFFELRGGATTGVLWLLLPDRSYVRVSDWLGSFAGLSEATAVALADGRVLLAGRTPEGPTARVLDPGRAEVRPRSIPLTPGQLFARDDGSVLAFSEAGLWVMRESARTRYDNPGGNLLVDDAADTRVLAFAAPDLFRREGLGLTAQVADARFDLAGLSYADVEITLRASGAGELLFRLENGAERSVFVGESKLGPTFCQVDAEPAELVTLVRSGARLEVRTGAAQRRCTLDGLEGPVALGFRARSVGAKLTELRVTRR